MPATRIDLLNEPSGTVNTAQKYLLLEMPYSLGVARSARRVWNPTSGYAYKQGIDYTDNGNGTIAVVPGSQLATDGSTGKLDYATYTASTVTDYLHYKLDTTNSGIKKLTAADGTWSGGTTIAAHLGSIHLIEHADGNQSNLSFTTLYDDAGALATVKGSYVIVRIYTLTDAGAALASDEWRFKVIQRDEEQDSDGIRYFRFVCADFSEDIKESDVTSIPRKAQAATVTYPGDTGGPPQESTIGGRVYLLSQLLADIKPSYATVILNAPDQIIERLPEEGNGLDLLAAALKATSYHLRWDGVNLIVEQWEDGPHSIAVALQDAHVYECKTELGHQPPATDSVIIERPRPAPRLRDTGMKQPDPGHAPVGESGSSPIPPDTVARISGDTTIYSANFTWEPPQQYVDAEPNDIMLAFDDPDFNNSGYTAQQIAYGLQYMPQQWTIEPPVRWTKQQVHGYNGFTWYFLIRPHYTKSSQSNLDFVDGYVVARAGYYDQGTGAINKDQNPIFNATVYLTGQSSGVILGPVSTNGSGYFRAETGGNRDKWIASVYVDGDAYQANKDDVFTSGHPFDDDPSNDGLGPDNRVATTDQWQVQSTPINFSVVYRTNRTPEQEDTTGDLPETYVGAGGFTWGDEAQASPVLIDGSNLEVDPANITNEVQAGLVAEKIIDRSSEEQTIYVTTKPFGGRVTKAGTCVKLHMTTGGGINAVARTQTREIRVGEAEVVEVLSSATDMFVNETDRRFARKKPTETRLRQIYREIQEVWNNATYQAGLLSEVYESGVK